MAVVVDTSGIFAVYDKAASTHLPVMEVISYCVEPLILPSAILAEVDYMLQSRFGAKSAIMFLASIEAEMFCIEPITIEDITRCRELLMKYHDLDLGLADVAVMATAERLGMQHILTLDERHFRVVRPKPFDHFILYPTDFKS